MDIGSALSRKARILGERELAELPNYRTSDAFTDLDRRVIEFAERLTMPPADMPESLHSKIRGAIRDDAIVDRASAMAWENCRSRLDRAFDVQAQGYCEGGFCVVPARPAVT